MIFRDYRKEKVLAKAQSSQREVKRKSESKDFAIFINRCVLCVFARNSKKTMAQITRYIFNRKKLASILNHPNEAEDEKISKEFYDKYKKLRIHLFEYLKEENKVCPTFYTKKNIDLI